MKKLFLLISFSLLMLNVAFSQWQQANNGLYGGNVKCIAISGSNIFAGTDGGVFLSSDNGQNWTLKNKGLTGTFAKDCEYCSSAFYKIGGNIVS